MKKKTRKPQASQPNQDKAVYDKVRREFSAAELQKYTEIEEGIPAQQVLADMEALHRRLSSKKER